MGCEQSKRCNILVPGKYIIRKNIDGVIKEQYAHISNYNNGIYEYDYGYLGYHEGCCVETNIRQLTEIEKGYENTNQTFKLPQQFYQSMPQ